MWRATVVSMVEQRINMKHAAVIFQFLATLAISFPVQANWYAVIARKKAAGGAFSPTDIASLELWLDATTGVYSDAGTTPAGNGDGVEQWNDQSGNGRNATQTGGASLEPTYTASVQNGKFGLSFDGTDSLLVNSVASSISGTDQAFTVFMVVQFDATSGSNPYFSLNNSADADSLLEVGSSGTTHRTVKRDDAASIVTVSGATLTDNQFYILMWKHTGTTTTMEYDDTASGSAGQSQDVGATTLDRAAVMARPSTGEISEGDVCDLLVFSTALSTGDEASMWTYLNNKWAVY